ncbi:MAG: hypothetical protein BGO49_03205 [Planctomycetales bacterium 71-10]|nr:MAG: hypothetical protein BGO49_03205 [Planctomycetales bacterium 71-10]
MKRMARPAPSLCLTAVARTASVDGSFIALAESITFGETDLACLRSHGDRGRVGALGDVQGVWTCGVQGGTGIESAPRPGDGALRP